MYIHPSDTAVVPVAVENKKSETKRPSAYARARISSAISWLTGTRFGLYIASRQKKSDAEHVTVQLKFKHLTPQSVDKLTVDQSNAESALQFLSFRFGYVYDIFWALWFVWGFISDVWVLTILLCRGHYDLSVPYIILFQLSFVMLAADVVRSRDILNRGVIGEAFVCRPAYNCYILNLIRNRSSNGCGSGYQNYCVLASVERSKRWTHTIAFFVNDNLAYLPRLILIDVPRFVLNVLALMALYQQISVYKILILFLNLIVLGYSLSLLFFALCHYWWIKLYIKRTTKCGSLKEYCKEIMNANLMRILRDRFGEGADVSSLVDFEVKEAQQMHQQNSLSQVAVLNN